MDRCKNLAAPGRRGYSEPEQTAELQAAYDRGFAAGVESAKAQIAELEARVEDSMWAAREADELRD